MTLEHGILAAAAVFFLACLVYAARGGKAPPLSLQALAAPLRSKHPIRSAFDAIEEEAKEMASKLMAEEIAQHYATEYRSKVQGALGPKASPPAAGSSS